jgi:hypothetical protein
MKWMLVIIVFGADSVKTDLVFDSLDKCLEEVMHAEQESTFQRWRAVFRETEGSLLTKEEALAKRRIGMENQATCIPHAQPATTRTKGHRNTPLGL